MRNLRATFSQVSAWSPTCSRSKLSSRRPAVFSFLVVARDAVFIEERACGSCRGRRQTDVRWCRFLHLSCPQMHTAGAEDRQADASRDSYEGFGHYDLTKLIFL